MLHWQLRLNSLLHNINVTCAIVAAVKFRPVRTAPAAHSQIAAKPAGFSASEAAGNVARLAVASARRAVAANARRAAAAKPDVVNVERAVVERAVAAWAAAAWAKDEQVDLLARRTAMHQRASSANALTGVLENHAVSTAAFTSAVST